MTIPLDGNLITCLETLDFKQTTLGQMMLIKDVTETRKLIKFTYNTDVNSTEVNIVHYHKMAPECSFLKMAVLQTGSDQIGSTCQYEVHCHDGHVTCKIELLSTDRSVAFSLCEIES